MDVHFAMKYVRSNTSSTRYDKHSREDRRAYSSFICRSRAGGCWSTGTSGAWLQHTKAAFLQVLKVAERDEGERLSDATLSR